MTSTIQPFNHSTHSDVVIRVENLSKKYIIGHQRQESYTALRDVISNKARGLFKKVFNPLSYQFPVSSLSTEEFWALKDVSFEIKQGERVGIIGRNGAGKSTLLKILSRITEPTSGRVSIMGKVSSLLEIGTGFHPELTGRENIFLNGAILGMSKNDIKKKFDEIVSFAEVDKFLDTPVKHYSSGMYVRLAFSVAAHLEPEILIVDEVLAVGDAQFQKKCLGKMEEVGKEGRTVLFVSHNMATISSLCEKGILLNAGKLIYHGLVSSAIHSYYANMEGPGVAVFKANRSEKRVGDEVVELISARIINAMKESTAEIQIDESFSVEMEYWVKKGAESLTPAFHFYREDGSCAFVCTDATLDFSGKLKSQPAVYKSTCKIPGNFLNEGIYFIGVSVGTYRISKNHFFEKNTLQVNVVDRLFNIITRGEYGGPIIGAVRPALTWTLEKKGTSLVN
jgi:lipopolysaccharide transport system ATP-binding protein